jgi:hypothetical protein
MSEYDLVVKHLRDTQKGFPSPAQSEPDNLDSKYLFPYEHSARPTEYSTVLEHQRRIFSKDDQASGSVSKVLGQGER